MTMEEMEKRDGEVEASSTKMEARIYGVVGGGRVIDEDCDGGDGCIKEVVGYVVVEKMHEIFKLNPWLCSPWDLFDEMHQRNVVSWVNDLINPLYIRNGPQIFAAWFVVGNVWIFGGNASDAPNLYRLCLVFLTISCIGYAMPFILCAMICCYLPCIISLLGVREDVNQMRGASEESINALPKHTFQLKRNGSSSSRDSSSGVDKGGVVAAGTEKVRIISGEDAVCCICLARYTDNDELRELPCTHFFHTDCVDKWLKINASCPLCKFEIAGSNENPSSTEMFEDHHCLTQLVFH